MTTTYEISGNEFVERQTRALMDRYKSSRPKPRNSAMGFPSFRRPRGGKLSLEQALEMLEQKEGK